MDRNCREEMDAHRRRVALRKESVDRNCFVGVTSFLALLSLSARRAWIEMFRTTFPNSCDGRSLSARRAWIEILSYISVCFVSAVALRKESVDRNDG